MKKLFTAMVCALILGTCFPAMAANYPPTKVIQTLTADDQNRIVACFDGSCKEHWVIASNSNTKRGFVSGTEKTIKNNRIFYLVPGGWWTEITENMIIETNTTPNGQSTAPATNGRALPTNDPEEMPVPRDIVSNFPTGTNTINESNPAQMGPINNSLAFLKANPTFKIILFGGASIDKNSWDCYVSEDSRYFAVASQHNAAEHPDAQFRTGKDVCNEELAWARARAVADYMIAHGANDNSNVNRVQAIKYATYPNTRKAQGQGLSQRLAAQSVIIIQLTDEQIIISNPQPPVVQPQNCPDCPEVKISYEIPENCGIIEERRGNDVLVKMLCVVQEPKIITVPGSTVIPPYERGKDLPLWVGAGAAVGLGVGYVPTGGDGGDGGDGGSNGGSGQDGGDGSAATVCNGDIGCMIGTTVGGALFGWAGYEIKEAFRKAKYERQVKAQQKAQQAQQPATHDPKKR